MATQVIDAARVRAGAKLLPTAKPPADHVINALPPEDQVLLTKLLTEPIDYVAHEEFGKKATERMLFGGEAKLVNRTATRFAEMPDPLTDAVSAGERVPTLSYAQEALLFMRYN